MTTPKYSNAKIAFERFTFFTSFDWAFSDKNIRKQKAREKNNKNSNVLTVTNHRRYRTHKMFDRMTNPLDKIERSDIYVWLSKYKNVFGESNESRN